MGSAVFFRHICVYRASTTYCRDDVSDMLMMIPIFEGQSKRLLRPHRSTAASMSSKDLGLFWRVTQFPKSLSTVSRFGQRKAPQLTWAPNHFSTVCASAFFVPVNLEDVISAAFATTRIKLLLWSPTISRSLSILADEFTPHKNFLSSTSSGVLPSISTKSMGQSRMSSSKADAAN